MPKQNNTHPAYNDYDIRPLLTKNQMTTIVAPDGTAPATMLQDTWFSIGEFEKGKSIDYKMHKKNNGVYVFLIEGEVKIGDQVMEKRDGLGVYDTDEFTFETQQDSHILLIEVPMI